ncbi:hypothetical protein K3495_g11310, partial [Podosphaera aphanis]
HRQPSEAFRVNDRVYLRLKNIRTKRPCKKLDWISLPYRVVQLVGSHAVKLDTPRGIHPVFHVNLVRRAREDPLPSQILQDIEPPAIEADDADEDHAVGEYIVEKIVDHRLLKNKWEVAVKWEGYPAPTWEPLEHLEDTAAIEEYEAIHNCPWKTSGGEGSNVMIHGIMMPQALPSSGNLLLSPSS